MLLIQLASSDDDPPSFVENLLRQLADDDAQECDLVTPRLDSAIASLECIAERPMKSIMISLFNSTEEIKEVEREKLGAFGAAAGDCTIQRVGWETWRDGKLFCDYSNPDAGARIQWSRYDSNTWLEAESEAGVSPERVFDWWNSDDSGAPANNRLPYPDRYERYIIETIDMKPSECHRAGGYKSSAGAIGCEHPGLEQLFFGYYPDEKSLHDALGFEPGKGSCVSTYRYAHSQQEFVRRRREPGRRTYKLDGVKAGTRDCYENSGAREVVVEWTNLDRRLFGFARRANTGDLESLFHWWKKTGRFLTD